MTNRTEILFQKFIDGTCTQQEFNELMDLLQSHQEEESVRAMLQKVYSQVEQTLPSYTYVDASGSLLPEPPAQVETAPKRIVRSHFRLAAAAAILLAASLITWVLLKQTDTVQHSQLSQTVTKSTEKKEQKHLVLSDGTQVWLNAASELTYPPSFDGKARVVYLKGEAYFDVKNAERIPFLIYTGNVVTKVLGTAFNIRAYPDQQDIRVEVKRGKVQVSKENKIMATLNPGQAVMVPSITQEAVELKKVKEEEVAEWTAGKLHYRDQSLKEILLDLERHFNAQIVVEDEALLKENLNSTSDKNAGLENVLDNICLSLGAGFEKKNGKYIIKQIR
jgi:transmembrane sensor